MNKLLYILNLFLLAATVSPAQTWTLLPLKITGCTCIVENPWEPGTLYFLHRGAIASTSDNGASWQYINFSVYADATPVTMTFDREDPDTWYLPVGEAGVLKTTDHGRTFKFSNFGLAIDPANIFPQEFREVYQHPEDANLLYLRSDCAIWRSTDRGESWIEPILTVSRRDEHLGGFVLDHRDAWTMYVFAGGEHRIYKSTDGGKLWTWYEQFPLTITRVIQNKDGAIWISHARTTDYGESWTYFSTLAGETKPYGQANTQVVYDAENEMYYLAAQGKGIYRMKRGEEVWKPTSFIEPDPERMIAHFYWLHYDDYHRRLWVLYGNRLYISSDAGDSFDSPSGGPYLGIATFIESPSAISDLIVLPSGITFDNGATWRGMVYESSGRLAALAISPLDSNLVVFGGDDGPAVFTNRGLSEYGIGYIRTFPTKCEDLGIYLYIYKTVKFNPHNPHQLLGGGNQGLWCVGDSVITAPFPATAPFPYLTPWPPGNYYVFDFDFHPEIDGRLYLLSQHMSSVQEYAAYLRYSEDHGASWRVLLTIPGYTGMDVLVNPANPDIILVASGDAIYRTEDAGKTWSNIRLPDPLSRSVECLAVDPRFPHMMYCGVHSFNDERSDPFTGNRQGGICVSSDYGKTWAIMPMDGLHNYTVRRIHYHENPRRLIISTNGGVYETLLEDRPLEASGNESPHPGALSLEAPFPNPARASDRISVRVLVDRRQTITLRLTDVLGHTVENVHEGEIASGRHILQLRSPSFAPGMYFLHLRGESGHEVQRLIIER